jgi:hypothetical protein
MVPYIHRTFIQVWGNFLEIYLNFSAMEWLSIARSSVKVYVNGKLEFESTLKYPDISEVISDLLYISNLHSLSLAAIWDQAQL